MFWSSTVWRCFTSGKFVEAFSTRERSVTQLHFKNKDSVFVVFFPQNHLFNFSASLNIHKPSYRNYYMAVSHTVAALQTWTMSTFSGTSSSCTMTWPRQCAAATFIICSPVLHSVFENIRFLADRLTYHKWTTQAFGGYIFITNQPSNMLYV